MVVKRGASWSCKELHTHWVLGAGAGAQGAAGRREARAPGSAAPTGPGSACGSRVRLPRGAPRGAPCVVPMCGSCVGLRVGLQGGHPLSRRCTGQGLDGPLADPPRLQASPRRPTGLWRSPGGSGAETPGKPALRTVPGGRPSRASVRGRLPQGRRGWCTTPQVLSEKLGEAACAARRRERTRSSKPTCPTQPPGRRPCAPSPSPVAACGTRRAVPGRGTMWRFLQGRAQPAGPREG